MTRTTSCLSAMTLISLGAAMFGLPANAQQEGFYQGQTADGHPVTVAVAKTSNGSLGLFSLDAGFTARCNGITHRYHGSVTNFFPENHFVNNRKKFNFTNFHVVHAAGQIVFQDENNASGSIAMRAAVLPRGRQPASAEYCVSPAQDFSVTFQFGGAAKSPSPSTATNTTRPNAAFAWRH